MKQPEIPEELVDEAIRWFARLRADDVSAMDRERFYEWLKLGRLQQRAFVEILELWEGASVIAQMPERDVVSFPPLAEFKRKLQVART